MDNLVTFQELLEKPRIFIYPHPILTTPTDNLPLNTQEDIDFKDKLLEVMISVCDKVDGLGLAASQLGFPYSVCICKNLAYKDIGDTNNTSNKYLKFINPIYYIVNEGLTPDTNNSLEGCLSIPGVAIHITRKDTVYVQEDGHPVSYHNDQANILQHEFDHLKGVTILDHAKPVAKRLAIKKLKKWHKRQQYFINERTANG